MLTFRADPGMRERVDDLARREAACCPFVDYRVETVGDEVIWTTSNPLTGSERAGIDVFLDALYALPDHAGSDIDGFLGRLADAGVEVVAVDDGFEVRSAPAESPSCRSRETVVLDSPGLGDPAVADAVDVDLVDALEASALRRLAVLRSEVGGRAVEASDDSFRPRRSARRSPSRTSGKLSWNGVIQRRAPRPSAGRRARRWRRGARR